MQVQITTRIEAELAEALGEIATRERRSLSAQLALIVEQWVKQEQSEKSESKD
jgi:hypothetical protein